MKIIGLILSILILCSSLFAQEAQKMDETGNLGCDDFISRIDNLIIGLNENPNSKGYIFVYEGNWMKYNNEGQKTYVLPHFGEAKKYISSMKIRFRFWKFPLVDRIVLVNAGFRKNFTLEFWIVPNGAIPPKATPTLTKMSYRKGKPKYFCGEF